MASKLVTQRLKLLPELGVIVDFSIENDGQPTAVRKHGLVTVLREVNDGESPVPEGHATGAVGPNPYVIRAAMGECLRHSRDASVQVVVAGILAIEKPGDAAHRV
jgi:hypothetical protein